MPMHVLSRVVVSGSILLLMGVCVQAQETKEVPLPQLPQGAGKIDEGVSQAFTKTNSGLEYRVLRKGTGAKPKATSNVQVNYHGWLDDGTVFDSSYRRGQPASFPLSGVIKGWTEGLQLVGEGGMIELKIPSGLAYGDAGRPGIPPKATLHFLVELLKVQ
jgi:FKBP-type peptidyl-prolyl cis-trans isomerase FkpA